MELFLASTLNYLNSFLSNSPDRIISCLRADTVRTSAGRRETLPEKKRN